RSITSFRSTGGCATGAAGSGSWPAVASAVVASPGAVAGSSRQPGKASAIRSGRSRTVQVRGRVMRASLAGAVGSRPVCCVVSAGEGVGGFGMSCHPGSGIGTGRHYPQARPARMFERGAHQLPGDAPATDRLGNPGVVDHQQPAIKAIAELGDLAFHLGAEAVGVGVVVDLGVGGHRSPWTLDGRIFTYLTAKPA